MCCVLLCCPILHFLHGQLSRSMQRVSVTFIFIYQILCQFIYQIFLWMKKTKTQADKSKHARARSFHSRPFFSTPQFFHNSTLSITFLLITLPCSSLINEYRLFHCTNLQDSYHVEHGLSLNLPDPQQFIFVEWSKEFKYDHADKDAYDGRW